MHLYPLTIAAIARPIPVLPLVPSMIVPPGLSSPFRSASSIIFTAIRSLMLWPGLNVSIFAYTVAGMSPDDAVQSDHRRPPDGAQDGVVNVQSGHCDEVGGHSRVLLAGY